MAVRARLNPPPPQQSEWRWHQVTSTVLSSSVLSKGQRRMEAENYLVGGHDVRLAMEAQADHMLLGALARVWQPSRLKGIQLNQEQGVPFLAATQVFDGRPTPRKWLSLDRTATSDERFVTPGEILVTCSGSVGRTTLAYQAHENTLISHDLLRVQPRDTKWWGWLYAFLRSSYGFDMMNAAQYGHMIKHLEVAHLEALPIPIPQPDLLEHFRRAAQDVLEKRNRAVQRQAEAEVLFEAAVGGPFQRNGNAEVGFEIPSSALFGGRRRFEASYHDPDAATLLARFKQLKLTTQPLREVTSRVQWMKRFKRVFGERGTPYMSADELFSLNPKASKFVVIEQTENAEDFFVQSGWIIMACSGQVYGLNGSVALMTKQHEHAFYSHDLIRIIPDVDAIRPGYLFTALGHRTLGRPLVIRNAYGTSIPHLEPADVAECPIVRLDDKVEAEIAELAFEAVTLRAEADEQENTLTSKAERLLTDFLAGDRQAFERMRAVETEMT